MNNILRLINQFRTEHLKVSCVNVAPIDITTTMVIKAAIEIILFIRC